MTTTYSRLRFVLLVGLGALLSACSDGVPAQADPVTAADGYREGYAEGSQIGIMNAWRDRVSADLPEIMEDRPSRYADDHDFRSGWKAGRKSGFESAMFPQKFREPSLASTRR